MYILFLADSNQLGESGVGDYALSLSASLRAFNVDSSVECLGPPGSSLRSSLVALLKDVQPDWVSLQFVPYACAKRGLVGRGTLPWRQLRGRIGTHLMFHELWIGAHNRASLQDRAIGTLQRQGIKNVVRELNPGVIHCTNRLYSQMLQQAGIHNNVLPLCGAIPVSLGGPDPYVEILTTLRYGSRRSGWIVAALFGSIHPSENLLPALQWLQDRCLRYGKRLLMVSLGKCPSAETIFKSLASGFPEAAKPAFFVKGRLSASTLSSWIRCADCALATTPFNIIEKSSSAVAFAEHGVPVIVTDAGADVRGVALPRQDLAPDFWLFGDRRLDALNVLPPRREPQPRIGRVVKQFLEDLHASGCA
jgi:hypothetical protein